MCLSLLPAQQGATVLHWAASRGYLELCALLLDRGASLEARDSSVRVQCRDF